MSSDVATAPLVQRAIDLARRLTGMDLAYVAELAHGKQVIRATRGDTDAVHVHVGDVLDLELTYCQRVVDGRLPALVPDTAADPITSRLAVTAAAGMGAYAGVPLRLPDGTLYGTLCCLAATPRPDLCDDDLEVLEVLGGLIGQALVAGDLPEALEAERRDIAAALAHDLRTPVMAIRFLAEDLASGAVHAHEAAEKIAAEATMTLALVDGLLDAGSRGNGRLPFAPREEDLVQLGLGAAQTANASVHADDPRVVADLPLEPLWARVDHDQVARALQNLLDNALKYSPPDRPVRLALRQDGPTAVYSVTDEGIGIEPADLGKITRRFYRAQGAVASGIGGLGFGLATVQAVADAHEGTLDVSSTPGIGSTFALRLPLRVDDPRG